MAEPVTNAVRQKRYRERKRLTVTVTAGVTPTVTRNVTGPTVTGRNAETVTALRRRVTELEEEVARLKRDLALANARPVVDYVGKVGMRTDAVSPSLTRAGIGKATVAKADFGCAGPGRCRKLACGHGAV